ncbi:MAG: hypothetical protein NVSMB14_14720 [Isosphaeraceae bacterium]
MEFSVEPALSIEIQDLQSRLKVDPEDLRTLARHVLRSAGAERAEVTIVLVDDATIRDLNRRHLNHDWSTDVITFPLSEPGEAIVRGELVVSAETAKSTAEAAGVDAWHELALYATHGLLHLLGLDDQTEADALVMRRREQEVLDGIGLVNPFSLIGAAGKEDSGESKAIDRREAARWPS